MEFVNFLESIILPLRVRKFVEYQMNRFLMNVTMKYAEYVNKTSELWQCFSVLVRAVHWTATIRLRDKNLFCDFYAIY